DAIPVGDRSGRGRVRAAVRAEQELDPLLGDHLLRHLGTHLGGAVVVLVQETDSVPHALDLDPTVAVGPVEPQVVALPGEAGLLDRAASRRQRYPDRDVRALPRRLRPGYGRAGDGQRERPEQPRQESLDGHRPPSRPFGVSPRLPTRVDTCKLALSDWQPLIGRWISPTMENEEEGPWACGSASAACLATTFVLEGGIERLRPGRNGISQTGRRPACGAVQGPPGLGAGREPSRVAGFAV